MTVAELSVHLFGQLLFVYVLLQDCSSSHCVALEGSQGQNREGGSSKKKSGERKTKAPQFRSRCSLFSLGGAFAVKRASCVIVALQNQYCTVMEKHMMPFKFLWDFSFFFFTSNRLAKQQQAPAALEAEAAFFTRSRFTPPI